MKSKAGLIIVLLLVGAPAAQAKECTKAMEDKAWVAVGHIASWPSLYAVYEKFRQCDDGGIAEDISEADIGLMADHWVDLAAAMPLLTAHPSFEDWVVDHLEATDADARIDHQVVTACPAGAKKFCQKLHAHIQSQRL